MKLGPKISRVGEQSQADETRLERLLEATNVVPWEADAQTWTFTYVGPQAEALLGYPPKRWYEKDFWASHIHPEDRESAIDFCQTSSKTLTDFEFEYHMIAADGRTVWLNDVVNVIAENGTPRLLRGFIKDITDRKLAEEALREAYEQLEARVEKRTTELRASESRLNAAQRLAKIGNWDRNLITNEAWWSAECYRLFGRTPETFKATRESFLEIVHPDDRQRVRQISDDATKAGKPYSIEYRIVLPDGSVKSLLGRAEAIVDQDGRAVRTVGTVQDITERTVLEREVVAAGEHERLRIGRDLHDGLGQELTGVSLALQLLCRKLEDERSDHIQTVQNLTVTIQSMIAEIRRIARELSPVYSTEMGLCAALRALAKEISENSDVNCDAHCRFDDDIHDVEVATHLYRIAQESINNALKHGGVRNIELRYGRDGDSLFLQVLDDGTGIPAKDSRIDGIGLRSMHYRARMLHGRLEVGLRTRGGTQVLCSCPFKPD